MFTGKKFSLKVALVIIMKGDFDNEKNNQCNFDFAHCDILYKRYGND